MGLLEKYGRKKTGEKRNKQIGAKIEPSLFDDFSAHCDNLGLSVSDGVRYLIMEELTKDKAKKVQSETTVTLMDHNEITSIKPKAEPMDNKGTTKVKPKVNKGTTKDNPLGQWTVNKQIPCPECDKWFSTRKSFYRHCRNTHNTSDYVQFMQSHLKKANEMVVAQQRENDI